jgi:DNA-binding MarR family transcriptional regulator
MDFFDALVRYETALWSHLESTLARRSGGSLAVLEALRSIASHQGEGRVAELQADLGITVGAASKLADRLERDGLVERRANPGDRRSSLLELTDAGQTTLERDLAVIEGALAEHLGTTDTAAVVALLGSLASTLGPVR